MIVLELHPCVGDEQATSMPVITVAVKIGEIGVELKRVPS